jgi:hypothetical protein
MGAVMNRNSWTSPFGLAFLVGSLAALVAGFFTGAGMRGGSELNVVVPMLNNAAEPYVDENALIAANREPVPPPAPAPAPAPVQAAPAAEAQAEPSETIAAPTTRSPSGTGAEAEPLPPEPRYPPRRRRSVEPPPEEDPGDEPPGF